MSRRRSLSDEERALWTGVARSIKPLRRAAPPADAAATVKSAGWDSERPKSTSRPADPPAAPPKPPPPLAPLERRLKQRVARGHDAIDARLDLHGYTQSEARAALLSFLRDAQARQARMVLVVTGKGTARSARDPAAERGVLKRAVPMWLALPEFRPLVVGFDDAHIGHGGQGALYVRLRRAR